MLSRCFKQAATFALHLLVFFNMQVMYASPASKKGEDSQETIRYVKSIGGRYKCDERQAVIHLDLSGTCITDSDLQKLAVLKKTFPVGSEQHRYHRSRIGTAVLLD